MKKLLTLAAMLVLAATAFAASARPSFADERDFTVYNRASVSIVHLYVSPAHADEWGSDQLDHIIRPGSSFKLHFAPGDADDACVFDIRFDAADGTTTKDWDVDLCSTGSLTFR